MIEFNLKPWMKQGKDEDAVGLSGSSLSSGRHHISAGRRQFVFLHNSSDDTLCPSIDLPVFYRFRRWSLLHSESVPWWIFNWKALRGVLILSFSLHSTFNNQLDTVPSKQILNMIAGFQNDSAHAGFQEGSMILHPYDRTSEGLFTVCWLTWLSILSKCLWTFSS